MAFTPDAFNTGVTENDTNAQSTFTLNVGSLTNGLLVVAVGWSTLSTTILNANFRGQSLILPITQATGRAAALLYLYSPPAGISTGTINFSANAGRSNICAGTWSGADTTYLPTGTSASGSDGAPSVTAPVALVDYLVVDNASVSFTSGDTLTAGADQTERGKISGGATITGFSSQDGVSGGAMTWTDSNATRAWGAVATSFKPATAVAGIVLPIMTDEMVSQVIYGGQVIR